MSAVRVHLRVGGYLASSYLLPMSCFEENRKGNRLYIYNKNWSASYGVKN